MTLTRTRDAFDHSDFVFELKYDGFRALAYVDGGRCRMVSRRNHVYKSYTTAGHWFSILSSFSGHEAGFLAEYPAHIVQGLLALGDWVEA